MATKKLNLKLLREQFNKWASRKNLKPISRVFCSEEELGQARMYRRRGRISVEVTIPAVDNMARAGFECGYSYPLLEATEDEALRFFKEIG